MPDQRVLAETVSNADRRFTLERHTDTVFQMPEFGDLYEEWEELAEILRRRMLVGSALHPLPEKTPLNAQVTEVARYEDYAVANVMFEVFPGFFVTGNLYSPIGEGPFPGVICPHGHWKEGRLEDSESGSVPARCITLARMGMVAFSYDMLGYNDSQQFEHRWSKPELTIWGIHPFGLQLLSSIRALDFLESLPEVDADRLGCTGASGGGTQTFALTAVDKRVRVSAPVNMISSTMQGGCVCENAPIIRLDNSNMEIGAQMAPRPMLLVSATGDWTRETPRVEFPAIRSIYALYHEAENLEHVQIDAGHNYNKASREAMYRFFGKHLLWGQDWSGYTEPAYEVEPKEKLRVLPDGPPEGAPGEEELIERYKKIIADKWRAILPEDDAGLKEFRTGWGKALADVLDAETPDPNDLRATRHWILDRDSYVVEGWTIGRAREGDEIPALFYRGKGDFPQDAALVVHGEGKAKLAGADGPGPLVAGLIEAGTAVLVIDAFLVGEHAPADEKRAQYNFPDTFVPSDTACRVQDVLTSLAFLRGRRDISEHIDIVGLGDAGIWTMLAAAVDGEAFRVVADLNNHDFNSDGPWTAQFYIPCIRSIGGIDTALALLRPEIGIEEGNDLRVPKLTLLNAKASFPQGAQEWTHLIESGDEALLNLLKTRAAARMVHGES